MTASTFEVKEAAKPRAPSTSWLHDGLLHECEVMAMHALSFGMQVPEAVVQALALAQAPRIPGDPTVPAIADGPVPGRSPQPGEPTLQQCWPDDRLRQLVFAHNSLVALVAPATPRTIAYLHRHLQRPGFWGLHGKVPFVRRMMGASMLFLLGFILIRVLPYINALLVAGNPAAGWPLLLEDLYYITAAGMGASFAVLYEVNRHTLQAAFDPIYEPVYWTRFALGLIAGLLLAELVPVDTSQAIYHAVSKPTLALTEAGQRPNIPTVPIKTVEQQDIQALHRVRERLVKHRTALGNQMRGLLLEYGIIIPQGIARLRKRLPRVLEEADNGLSFLMRDLLQSLQSELS